MEIVLVRHGQPEWIRDGLNVDDPPLTDLGHRQAALVGEALAGLGTEHVAVSPMVRARQTAAPLLASLRLGERIEPWLEEIRNPAWHGTPASVSADAFAAEEEIAAEDRWAGLPGGEPARDFVDRVVSGATRWLAAHGVRWAPGRLPTWEIDDLDRRIVAVAHGGTNGVLICHLLGIDPTPWEWQRFVHLHAGITRFESFRVGTHHAFALAALSNVEHLPRDLRTQ